MFDQFMYWQCKTQEVLASFARITDRAVYTASQPSTDSIDGDALAVITISTWIQTQTPFKTI